MWGQSFEWIDAPRLGILSFLEILLSADNALVLGVLIKGLPEVFRRKALWIGVFSAFLLRAAALLSLSFLLQFLWLQVLGGLYLLFLAYRHFSKRSEKQALAPPSFWKTVLYIELLDLAFALDSIMAGVAFITDGYAPTTGIHPKLWVVYVGGMLGLLVIRYAADLMSRLLDKLPRLETSAYLMVGWIGLKLMTGWAWGNAPAFAWLFWGGLAGLLALGCRRKREIR